MVQIVHAAREDTFDVGLHDHRTQRQIDPSLRRNRTIRLVTDSTL